MLFKTLVSCLFNDTWCYLVIGCFDWTIGIFQQTVVRGYCILKGIYPSITEETLDTAGHHCWTPTSVMMTYKQLNTVESICYSTITKYGKRNMNLALMLLWGVMAVQKWTCRDTYIVTFDTTHQPKWCWVIQRWFDRSEELKWPANR